MIKESTLKSLKSLTESVNKSRVELGEKELTMSDVLHEAVEFLHIEHLKAKRGEAKDEKAQEK